MQRVGIGFLFLFVAMVFSARGQADRTRQVYLNQGLRGIGNVANGRRIFFDERRAACSRCHETTGTVAKVGPSLATAGDKFGRRELIEAILSPSASIAVGFETVNVETKGDESYSGVLRNANDQELELVLADASTRRVARSEIARQSYSAVSLMPEGLQSGLSTNEFLDLVEFVETLKLPASANLAAHGMPTEIPLSGHPIELTAIHSAEARFKDPVWFGQVPGDSGRFIVLEHQRGKIWRLDVAPLPEQKTLFLDLGTNVVRGGTRGLIGFAFHPQFRTNHRYFVNVHTNENGTIKTITEERESTADCAHDSGKPPRRILEIDTSSGVHYGGSMQFGPDGFLYIGMGDTGPQEDPNGNGQNMSLLRGKISRIDIDHGESGHYRVPSDNPFVGHPGIRPEIWAAGFREPWRFSFDPETGELWVGDVGQDRYEEVDIVKRGGNYGWNVFEGFETFSNKYRRTNEVYLPPVFAYTRKYGPSVTGGFVYRGERRSSLFGAYIFGDYETRRIFALWQEQGKLKKILQIGTAPERIVSFGQDEARRLYVVGYAGTIFRMELAAAGVE